MHSTWVSGGVRKQAILYGTPLSLLITNFGTVSHGSAHVRHLLMDRVVTRKGWGRGTTRTPKLSGPFWMRINFLTKLRILIFYASFAYIEWFKVAWPRRPRLIETIRKTIRQLLVHAFLYYPAEGGPVLTPILQVLTRRSHTVSIRCLYPYLITRISSIGHNIDLEVSLIVMPHLICQLNVTARGAIKPNRPFLE